MKITTFQFSDSINSKKPQEDSFKHTDNLFVVADGITRDPINSKDFSTLTFETFFDNYPNPSPARTAADNFVDSVLSSFSGDLKEVYYLSNSSIKELNEARNPIPDFLENDYWACVAATAYINENKLYWSVIGDCRVKVFDKDNKVKFESPNSVEIFEKYFFSKDNPRFANFDWKKPEDRILIRKEFRNNPKQIVNNKCVSYGAITGERDALDFMHFGELELDSGDLVLVYSDGFEKIVNDFKLIDLTKEELEKLFIEKGKEDYSKYGHERTLIMINI